MTRRRIDLGHVAEAQIRALMARGGTVESITAALRAGGVASASPATIARRMREMRGEVNAARVGRRDASVAPVANAVPETSASAVPPPAAVIPASPDDIPEGASLGELAELRGRCKTALSQAEDEGDLKLVGQLIRVQAALEDLIRKATPPKPADPNDDVDMVALGAEVAQRLHKLVDQVVSK